MISVELPDEMERDLEEKKEGNYSSMADVVREALREYLEKEEKSSLTPKEKAILELIRKGKVGGLNLEGELDESLKRDIEELEDFRSEK